MLTYKNLPLVRSGNVMYLGDYSQEYVVKFTICNYRSNGPRIPSRVRIQLMRTKSAEEPTESIRSIEKSSLADSMVLGYRWLVHKLGIEEVTE